MKRCDLTHKGHRVLSVADWICAVLLALLPILQHYRGLVGYVAAAFLSDILPAHYVKLADNMSITLMILMAPYMAVQFFARLREKEFKGLLLVSPLIAFYLFKIVDHGTSVAELLQVGLSVGYLVCLGVGCIDLKKFTKAATAVACMAGVGIIAQYVCYYGFDDHLQLVPTQLLLPSADQWVALAQTGRISVTGSRLAFYRPSSVFLEPSHLFMYAFPLLFINLYKSGKKVFHWVASILLSVAIVLSTSGMGVAVTFGAWVLFAALCDVKSDSLKLTSLRSGRQWLRGICTALVLLLLFLNVPSINNSMARIIGRKEITISMFFPQQNIAPPQSETIGGATQNETIDGETSATEDETIPTEETSPQNVEIRPIISDNNAVTGRVKGALRILKKMNSTQWIIGCADSVAGSDTHMPGFMSIAYKYGIIGLLLSYAFFAYGLIKFNAAYFWATVIWFGISFFSTHTHGMIYILFYIMLLYGGFWEREEPWLKESVCAMFKKPSKNVETEEQ